MASIAPIPNPKQSPLHHMSSVERCTLVHPTLLVSPWAIFAAKDGKMAAKLGFGHGTASMTPIPKSKQPPHTLTPIFEFGDMHVCSAHLPGAGLWPIFSLKLGIRVDEGRGAAFTAPIPW